MKNKIGIFYKLIILVTVVIMIAISIMMIFMRDYVTKREWKRVEEKIELIADRVASDSLVKRAVETNDFSGNMQSYANQIQSETGVGFVVIMNADFVRLSHPTNSLIGQQFSNLEDVQKTVTQGDHLSHTQGTMGMGVRYFSRIYNDDQQIIGVVCVGYLQVVVEKQIVEAQMYLVFVMIIGLISAFLLAYLFSRWLKKVLLNLEPEEIAKLVVQRRLISDHITDGIIAIDKDKMIIVMNSSAHQLLNSANLPLMKERELIDNTVYQLFFEDIFETYTNISNKRIVINNMDIVLHRNCIYIDEKLYGAVVTFSDQSQMQSLITELSGTEKYNDALRAQSHHFLNQMHVLQGLIEMKQYEEVSKYIAFLQTVHHEQLGFVSDKIKVPVIVGLLLQKIEEARNMNINLIIDSDSYVPNEQEYESIYHELTIILGVLIDNSIDALMENTKREMRVYLHVNEDEKVLICSVKDLGKGIIQEHVDKILEKGYSTKGENRGYGLSYVMSVVDKYKGNIDIDTKVNVGTTITIEIPL